MKKPTVQTYLFLRGRCEEALEFYSAAIGAQVEMVTKFNQSPEPPAPGVLAPGWESKVMHSSFRIGDTVVMASDGCDASGSIGGFSLALSFPTEADAHRAFAALSAGGEVTMPLTKTFWSPCFGMLTDKFGIGWMVSILA